MKMRFSLVSLMIMQALLVVSAGAVAQQAPHVCGAGPGPNETMAGVQPAGPGVAPTPLCYWKSGAGAQQAAPQVRWADRWGAIAADSNAVYGIVTDQGSKGDAQRAAILECEKRGGRACQVQLAYHNQCAVVIAGTSGSNVSHAETEDEAKKIGVGNCEKVDGVGACRVYYSGCSLPVQVQ